METNYLLLSIGTATFGFVIWFLLSASLRLPKTFQIQFDINGPFINRIFRRRILMFILYAMIPYLLIVVWNVLGNVTTPDLGINFGWNSKATFWVLILVPVAVIYNLFASKSDSNLTEFPEIRVTRWTIRIFILSALTWAFQVFAMEFLYRGLLLQSLRAHGLSDLIAIILSTGVYTMSHYFKQNLITILSIPYGLLACYIVIDTSSLLPVIIIHLANALCNEWFSIWRHPEIRTS